MTTLPSSEVHHGKNLTPLQPDEVDYVIYHHPCTDGFGSAFVAWKYLSARFPKRTVTYYPASIGASPPNDVTGRNVLICDYSYRKADLMNLIGKVNKLLILDHHKSAQKELSDVPSEYKVFDMHHSGAWLTWNFFFPNHPVPSLIAYIQDRDLWTNQLPHINEFAAWFWTLPFEFEVFDKFLDATHLQEMIVTRGSAFMDLNNYYLKQALEAVAIRLTKINGKMYLVGSVNSSILKSDIGNRILIQFPHLDFSAVYTIDDQAGTTRFSLRSTDQHVDVSEIATSLGGGGHRNASGIVINGCVDRLPGPVYEYSGIYGRIQKVYSKLTTFPGIGTYNIVYLHSPIHKGKLAKYLVQTKYVDPKTQAAVQVSDTLLGQKDNQIYALSAVWDYDPLTDTTTFVIAMAPWLSHKVSEQIATALGLDRTYQVVHSGCQKFLPDVI